MSVSHNTEIMTLISQNTSIGHYLQVLVAKKLLNHKSLLIDINDVIIIYSNIVKKSKNQKYFE